MRYTLRGRYGPSYSIRQTSTNRWALRVLNGYCRYGLTPDHKSLAFVDADGGPFIELGATLWRYNTALPKIEITKIEHVKGKGIVLHTEPQPKDQ